jgi:hypothetical protein
MQLESFANLRLFFCSFIQHNLRSYILLILIYVNVLLFYFSVEFSVKLLSRFKILENLTKEFETNNGGA